MLHILLTILKVIGIIILVILSLIVLIVVCLLFVPLRYNADISYKNELRIKSSITYLLHIVTIKYDNKSGHDIIVRIFGIKTHFFDKEIKKKEKKYDEETEMFEKMSDSIQESQNESPEKYEQFKRIDEERDKLIINDNNANQFINPDNESKSNLGNSNIEDEKDKDKSKKKSLFKKIYDKIYGIISKIKYRFKHFCDTIKKIFKNVNDFKEFISDDSTKEAYYFLKDEVIILLKHIRPRKIKGYIHFGFDDPSYTGKLLGIIYIFTRGTHKNFQINADFENKILEGDVHIKGHIQAYMLLIIGLKLYRNDNLKLVLERRRTNGRE